VPQLRVRWVSLLIAGLLVALATVASLAAQDSRPSALVASKDTGMFGLTPGRVARIDAVNLSLGANPADVHLELFDAAGALLAEKFVTLAAGESSALDFSSPAGQTGRLDIRARASILDDSNQGIATRCGRNVRVSALVLTSDTGQTLRKVRVFHRDVGVCAKGRKAMNSQ
jgi:hypothetical protein